MPWPPPKQRQGCSEIIRFASSSENSRFLCSQKPSLTGAACNSDAESVCVGAIHVDGLRRAAGELGVDPFNQDCQDTDDALMTNHVSAKYDSAYANSHRPNASVLGLAGHHPPRPVTAAKRGRRTLAPLDTVP